jgi:ABC-type multidrug transport system fused ATPase/permease subunit
MAIDKALIEKREELKHRLDSGEYKTLVDAVLEFTDRTMRKLVKRSKPIPIWFNTLILVLVTSLLIIAGPSLDGQTGISLPDFFELLGVDFWQGILLIVMNLILVVVGPVIINAYIGRIMTLWRNHVVDSTESVESLKEFTHWLGMVSNRRLQLLLTIVVALIQSFSGIEVMSYQMGIFLGYGWVVSFFFLNLFGFTVPYLFYAIILLSANIHRYELNLFAADPASSELISRLADAFGIFVYYVGGYATFVTFDLILLGNGDIPLIAIVLIPLFWLPIILLFVLYHTGLSRIIRRAKWKTINEIQAKVENLQSAKNFGDKESVDAITRLMDYHDRVKTTHNSAVNLNILLNFFNSLLLPLLAFILGNLDLVFSLFTSKP